MASSRFFAWGLTLPVVLASCATPEVAPSTCDLAAARVAECADLAPMSVLACDPADEIEAELLVSMTCEELDDSKADGRLRCSALGRRLGLCVRVATDDELLARLGGATGASIDGPFEVLVWNVYKGGEDAWDADMRAIEKGFEIFMVQEFFLDDDSRETFESVEASEWLFATSFFDADGLPTGVATGSRVASISGAPLRSPDAEPVLGTPKMALITTYDLAFSDDDLLVVNVHGINFRTGGAFAAQMAMIERAVAPHVGPMILAGDFNTWSSGRHETLTHMTRALGLSPVEPADDERGFLRLDHVFVRELSVRGARFVNGLDSSDHAPIAVALGALVP